MGVEVFDCLDDYLRIERCNKSYLAGGVMAGSIATLAILWVSLQTLGFLGHSHSIGTHKLPESLQTYLASYTEPLSGLPAINYDSDVIVNTVRRENRRFPRIDGTTLNNSITYAQAIVDKLNTLERNLANAGIELQAQSPAEKQFWNSNPSADAFERSIDAIVAGKASLYLRDLKCRRFGLDNNDCAHHISTLGLQGTPLGESCAAMHNMECNEKLKYRSIDGTCNNIENPSWGSAMTAYSRVLFSQYFDGFQQSRRIGHTKRPLPSPRLISAALSTANDQSDASRTLAVMEWSQFIAHDIAHTAVRKMVSNGKPISCCQRDGDTLLPRHIHPDCSPISVSYGDPVYGKHDIRCMNYVRSLPVLKSDCTLGPIEQMNQVTHFVDGSTIYGSTRIKSRKLRTFENGHLRVDVRNNHTYLPKGDAASQCGENCYNSGDDRVNIEPQLAVLHTIWHREHNRIADNLAKLNPDWSDETLYQEARRIVIAEIQHITYKEWLPILLGRRYVRAVGLIVGNYPHYSRNYNSDDEPSVSNEVANAALRFLNSLVQGKLSLPDNSHQQNKTLNLAEHFFNPRVIESEEVFDGLLRGLATQTSQRMDISLISDMTSKLYSNGNNLGLDAVSLDIERGRDHGLPVYNYYRRHCGLPAAKTFDDFLDNIPIETVNKLRTIYGHPDDVDLIVGGMAERPADDGMVGPTFRCLIYEQFSRSRRTDRFFYDSVMQPHPFTPEQLAQLHNVSLARIFCDNGENITQMQRNVFLKPQVGNELKRCTDFEAIPSVDLFAWAERAKAYR
ncbi:peroxidase isoform X2 [Camponotus floridanus]|uniref:peroxidase isoform X2 n=1 Tax=Camponotus floridanus TaxID=104421 RepID=UPI00059C9B07|nr:peroxidase isoform X2 [Camponotus floridanus]